MQLPPRLPLYIPLATTTQIKKDCSLGTVLPQITEYMNSMYYGIAATTTVLLSEQNQVGHVE